VGTCRTRHKAAFQSSLSPQAKTGNQAAIPFDILISEVLEKPSALADHHQQTPPAVMVFLIDLQVLGEMADALGEQRNLNLGRTRVRVVQPMFFDNRLRVFHAEVSFEKRKRGRTSGEDCNTSVADGKSVLPLGQPQDVTSARLGESAGRAILDDPGEGKHLVVHRDVDTRVKQAHHGKRFREILHRICVT
jgi:hypothetical protein